MNAELDWSDFYSLNDAAAIAKVRAEDRATVRDTHAKLPGQSLATTVYNLLRHGVVKAAA